MNLLAGSAANTTKEELLHFHSWHPIESFLYHCIYSIMSETQPAPIPEPTAASGAHASIHGAEGGAAQNPDYNKFDLCKEFNVPEEDVRRIHSGIVEKKSFLNVKNVIPAQRDPTLGLQLDQKEDGTVVVTGMKLLSPFQATRLEVGFTIICINGVVGPWESAEACGKVITDAENKVHMIFANMKDGHFIEFVSYDKDGTPHYPMKPSVKK